MSGPTRGRIHPATATRRPLREGDATPFEQHVLDALDKVRHRAARHGAMRVELHVTGSVSVPRDLADHVYRIVQDSLTNVARHAEASWARVNVHVSFDRVWITITDDGMGFPYHGRYVLADLVRRQFGPVSVRDRVAALRGDMVLSSNRFGSQLDIALPLHPR